MNLDAKAGRNWRRSRKKGVSPIIATILLVAITVVLAAVLYVLISGLTKGPGNTPIGSAFGYGTVSNVTSTAPTGCVAAKECYSLQIASATSGLTPNGMTFSVKNGGATVSITNWKFVLITTGGAYANANWTGAGGCSSPTGVPSGCNTALVSDETILMSTTGTASLSGYIVDVVGQGSFSGSSASPPLPL